MQKGVSGIKLFCVLCLTYLFGTYISGFPYGEIFLPFKFKLFRVQSQGNSEKDNTSWICTITDNYLNQFPMGFFLLIQLPLVSGCFPVPFYIQVSRSVVCTGTTYPILRMTSFCTFHVYGFYSEQLLPELSHEIRGNISFRMCEFVCSTWNDMSSQI